MSRLPSALREDRLDSVLLLRAGAPRDSAVTRLSIGKKKARRKPGRPRQGQGAKVISVTVERNLLARSDALAKNMGVTRAGMIARGLKAVLAAEGKL